MDPLIGLAGTGRQLSPSVVNGATQSIDLIHQYQRIDVGQARNNARTYFGDGVNADPGIGTQLVTEFTVARGDVVAAGVANAGELTDQGKTAYSLRLKSTFLATHLWTLIDDNSKRYMRNSRIMYEWKDAITGEIYRDGITMLVMCLHRLRPDKIVDTFKLIQEIKAIRLPAHDNDLTEMLDAIFEKRDQLAEIDPLAYPATQFGNDLFDAMSEYSPEAFQKWVETKRTNWITGAEPFLEYHVMQQGTQVYNNLLSTGKWKTDFSRDQQILALTTRCEALEQGRSSSREPDGKQSAQESLRRDKRDKNPKVAIDDPAFAGKIQPWRCIKDGPTKEDSSGKKWTWCDRSGHRNHEGKEVPMYAGHKNTDEGHERFLAMKLQNKNRRALSSTAATADKPSSIRDKSMKTKPGLRTAFMTEAGMSDSQFEAIWKEHGPAEN